ncbi:TWiK family of potassium channels protein 7-like [Acanthaster planci]|uniref:TWiK family of potassium channels protein 7-like n=1 Tax=Acanthaster planci TaxID=133434 RepID=A0A8B7XIR4_ACAPL|nr:TWiK family of potassium channels protein 7-like [Acanthaster planci]
MGVVSAVKRFTRAVIPHIIVLSLLFGYLIFGAAVFSYLESGNSDVEMYNLERDELKEKLMSIKAENDYSIPSRNESSLAPGIQEASTVAVGTSIPDEDVGEVVNELIDRSLRPEWKVGRMQAVQSNRAWSFASSMLFCLTTITTIGYGDVVPVTVEGKVFCVIYSIFGIPLTMLYMGGIGSFLARLILTLCKILHLGQPIKRAMCPCGTRRKSESYEAAKSSSKRKTSQAKEVQEEKAEKDGSMAELSVVTTQHGVEAGHGVTSSVEDELEAPVLLVVAIITGYMCAGAFLMAGIEDWSYGEALYFTFITLTTIGFGDYVPMMLYKEDAFFVCMVYALFGLAVISMCIALVQAKVRRLGNRFWDCIGC